jgi:hypothetical protein
MIIIFGIVFVFIYILLSYSDMGQLKKALLASFHGMMMTHINEPYHHKEIPCNKE